MIKFRSKSKLTLWIPEEIKDFGKRFSRGHDESLSSLLTNYLRRLRDNQEKAKEITPIVKNLSSLAKGAKITEKDYKKYLEKKYLNG